MAIHNELGKKGEEIAKEFLIKKGYEIIVQNYRYRSYEVDIIALYEKQIIAIEVKTRSQNSYGNPEEFVTKKQMQHLRSAMNHFVITKDSNFEVRFDIISILKTTNEFKIKHLEDAFYIF